MQKNEYTKGMICIIWDWNGTILDDAKLGMESINCVLEEYGLGTFNDLEDYRKVFGFPIVDYYRTIGLDDSIDTFENLAQKYMEHYQPRSYACPLTPSSLEAFQLASSFGYKQYILSASRKDLLLKQIEIYPIDPYIQNIYGIEDIYAYSKLELARQVVSSWKEDEIYMIGDSIHDHEVAKELHVRSLLVSTGHQSKQRLLQCGVPVFDRAIDCVRYIHERTIHSSQ